jgi:hypothetical protein
MPFHSKILAKIVKISLKSALNANNFFHFLIISVNGFVLSISSIHSPYTLKFLWNDQSFMFSMGSNVLLSPSFCL